MEGNTLQTNSRSKLTEVTWEESELKINKKKGDMIQTHKDQCQNIIKSINLYSNTPYKS